MEGLNAWLLDACPGFVIPTCLVLCHPREKAAKHYPIPTLGRLNLQSEQDKGQGSKTHTCTRFDRLIGNLGPAFPPLLVLRPLLAVVLRTTHSTSCFADTYRVAGTRASWISLCCPSWRTIVFSFMTSEKKKSFVFCPALFFVSRECHQFPKQRHPSPKWEVSADSSPGYQLLRETWLLPVGSSEQKDRGLGAFSSPGAAWGKELCSPRLQVQRWMCKARAVLPGQAGSPQQACGHARGSYSPRQGGSPVLPAPPVFLPKASCLS